MADGDGCRRHQRRDSLWTTRTSCRPPRTSTTPSALVARLQAAERGEQPAADEFDEALARLLDGDDFSEDAPAEDSTNDADEDGDAAPEGDRPV